MDARWTEVSSALPRTNRIVIAWAKDGPSQAKKLRETFFNGRDFVYGYDNNCMRGVTHWMDFPEPPDDLPACTCLNSDERKACKTICSEVPF